MSGHQNPPPKRPRLSLQIKAISSGPNLRASRTIAAVVNPTSPTSFNTLSNVYATAIDRSTPVTAINTKQNLKLQTQNLAHTPHGAPTPFVSGPETPLTAQPISPAVASLQEVCFPSTMTATPPLSAGPVDGTETQSFSFSAADMAAASTAPPTATPSTSVAPPPPATPQAPSTATHHHRRTTLPLTVSRAPARSLPYVRNRSLHSILRNSPLPPPTARTPISPRRQSQRLADRAARRVCYESPIERVITTNEYVTSHIDLLLAEDISPLSTTAPSPTTVAAVDADADDDATRDGGMTPGPFEEMRRRMAGLVARTPTSPLSTGGSPSGVRKRKRKERNRQWVWTIGNEEEDEGAEVGGALAASRAAAGIGPRPGLAAAAARNLPSVLAGPVVPSPMDEVVTPSIETFEEAGGADVTMSDSEVPTSSTLEVDERRAISLTPSEMDVDMITPTVPRRSQVPESAASRLAREESEGLFNPETGTRRDTPVPADMITTG